MATGVNSYEMVDRNSSTRSTCGKGAEKINKKMRNTCISLLLAFSQEHSEVAT